MDIESKKELGDLGEKVAAEYLREKGYTIIQKNFMSEWGEIDIIASDKNWTLFIEVKTRTDGSYGSPEESIDFKKIDRIRKAAIAFLKDNKPGGKKSSRFDAISIIVNRIQLEKLMSQDTGSNVLAGKYKMFSSIDHITDAF
jgi:putative endonuclease